MSIPEPQCPTCLTWWRSVGALPAPFCQDPFHPVGPKKEPVSQSIDLNAESSSELPFRAQRDAAYAERNQCVALIGRMAVALGWQVGVGEHPKSDTSWEADWRTVLFIQLPAGQVSWHFHDSERHLLDGLPISTGVWDGHSTDLKYLRVNATRPGPDTAYEELLRDRYAGLALEGMLASLKEAQVAIDHREIAIESFEMANEMLTARKRSAAP